MVSFIMHLAWYGHKTSAPPSRHFTGVECFLSRKKYVEIALEPSVAPGIGPSCDLMSAPRQSQVFEGPFWKAVEMFSSISDYLKVSVREQKTFFKIQT